MEKFKSHITFLGKGNNLYLFALKYAVFSFLIKVFFLILQILIVKIITDANFLPNNNFLSEKLETDKIINELFNLFDNSYLKLFLTTVIFVPLIENTIMTSLFKFLIKYIHKINILMIALALIWGGIHAFENIGGILILLPISISFFLMHDLYARAIFNKKKHPWIFPFIQHSIGNLLIFIILYFSRIF